MSALRLFLIVGAVAVCAAAAGSGLASPGRDTAVPALYKNCTNLNKKYPHGVGRVGARDKTSGTPVTTFKRSNRIFAIAMGYNRGLDRDKDKIACEKR
jgi:hypothetical protein